MTWADPMKLRRYSPEQLIEELARRANERPTARPAQSWHATGHAQRCEGVIAPA